MRCQEIAEPWATASRNTCRLAASTISSNLPTETARVNRNGANERESSTKGSTESLGILSPNFREARGEHGATVPERFC